MGKTEKLTELVEQASNKNPLMAAGLIKQAAALSADVLADHERQLETAAGAIGQQSAKVTALGEAYANQRSMIDAMVRDVATLAGLVGAMRETVTELAARSGLQFAPGSGVVYQGEYTNG